MTDDAVPFVIPIPRSNVSDYLHYCLQLCKQTVFSKKEQEKNFFSNFLNKTQFNNPQKYVKRSTLKKPICYIQKTKMSKPQCAHMIEAAVLLTSCFQLYILKC